MQRQITYCKCLSTFFYIFLLIAMLFENCSRKGTREKLLFQLFFFELLFWCQVGTIHESLCLKLIVDYEWKNSNFMSTIKKKIYEIFPKRKRKRFSFFMFRKKSWISSFQTFILFPSLCREKKESFTKMNIFQPFFIILIYSYL